MPFIPPSAYVAWLPYPGWTLLLLCSVRTHDAICRITRFDVVNVINIVIDTAIGTDNTTSQLIVRNTTRNRCNGQCHMHSLPFCAAFGHRTVIHFHQHPVPAALSTYYIVL
eukprot:6212362-Pleurochrysis_carterae.AAC.11